MSPSRIPRGLAYGFRVLFGSLKYNQPYMSLPHIFPSKHKGVATRAV